jgi:hypothetical protein
VGPDEHGWESIRSRKAESWPANDKAERGGALTAKLRSQRATKMLPNNGTIAGAMWSPNTRKLRLLLRKAELLPPTLGLDLLPQHCSWKLANFQHFTTNISYHCLNAQIINELGMKSSYQS